MGYGIPGFNITITRNGNAVRVKSGSVTREARRVAPTWELQFVEPMNISASDTWTIIRSFAGYDQVLINEARADNISGTDGLGVATRRVSGSSDSGAADDILNYCVPKTLVFFNPDWLRAVAPGAKVEDGIIKTAPITPTGYGFTIPGKRFYYDRLPGKEFSDTDFECIPAYSHHQIAQKLAAMVGFDLVVNTPDIPLIDTYTVASGTIWFAAIKANFETLWQPSAWIASGTIYIVDILSDDATVQSLQVVSIDNPAIVSTSSSLNLKQNREIDHVIITGRQSKNTTSPYDEPDFTEISASPVALSITHSIPMNTSFDRVKNRQQGSSYTGSFGNPAYTPVTAKQTFTTMNYHVERDPVRGEKWVLVSEETIIKDQNDTILGKIVVSHEYSADFKPIATTENEWGRIKQPRSGSDEKILTLLRTKTTTHNKFIKPLNLSLTSEMVEALVLFDESTAPGGTTYKEDPVVLADALQQDSSRELIETDISSTQNVVWMATHFRNTWISRVHDDHLIKRDSSYTVLPDAFRVQSQLLENPKRDPKSQSTDALFRREYFDGSGHIIGGQTCFHPPKTISHPDITIEAQAEQIRDRAFARRNIANNEEITIQTPVPIPLETCAIKVRLPNFSQDVNGTTVTVVGGDYDLKSIRDAFAFEGDGNQQEIKSEQTLTVKAKL